MLEERLAERMHLVRDPAVVMAPLTLGAARLTRYSFSRMMVRRAFADGWLAERTRFVIDSAGRGEAVYQVTIDGNAYSFVAFTTTLQECNHSDRVVAKNWEITAALVEGCVTDEYLDTLRNEVTQQERGRLGPNVLVLTRGNRSVRFFDYLVDRLAIGQQPTGEAVADAGYIMRSTAFYGNGKYGMRSFEGYGENHPLGVPYRAQMLAAWCFRELSFDVVEHCAAAKAPDTATVFDGRWRRFFGLGNATGMGLVPYALKHPRVIHAWMAVRETALADVRQLAGSQALIERFEWWLSRAAEFFASGTSDDCSPFLNSDELSPVVAQICAEWQKFRPQPQPFDKLYRWSQHGHVELRELVVSLLIELHEADDSEIDAMLRVDERCDIDTTLTTGELSALTETRFGWLDDLDLTHNDADHYWWLISDNTEEPRRAPRERLDAAGRDVAIDVAHQVQRLRNSLAERAKNCSVAELLHQEPDLRFAVERVLQSSVLYGEPRDNVCDGKYLPLQLQRMQLAMYGMDNFKPKSTDWLRVTLLQGAPRLMDLMNDVPMHDQWAMPPQPRNDRA